MKLLLSGLLGICILAQSSFALAQTSVIKGSVYNEINNEPVLFASVNVDSTAIEGPIKKNKNIMKFEKQILIHAPAEKVWDVLGRDFANIGVWSTGVTRSYADNKLAPVNNSPVGGRVSKISFAKVSEEFVAYDDDKKSYTSKGRSPIFRSHISTNELKAIDENTTEVKTTTTIELTFIGRLFSSKVTKQLNNTLDQTLDDLKYYVENGKPSPAKLASQKK